MKVNDNLYKSIDAVNGQRIYNNNFKVQQNDDGKEGAMYTFEITSQPL